MSIVYITLTALGLMAVMVLGWLAFTGPSVEKASARRLQAVRYRHSESTTDKMEAQLRKAVAARKPMMKHVAGSKSRIEALYLRLDRTGKGWTMSQYLYASLGIAVVVTILVYMKTGAALLGVTIGLVAGLGIPHMAVSRAINKRMAKFTSKFPDGIELLVRGLRSGLPVTETLGVVASEVPGPVGEEFKIVTERIKIGKTMEDALQDTADRLNTAEFSFFCITLAIQRETGGNLAETLSNLADVLRKRAQMKLKIKAMSSESKASAFIIGSLPFAVFGIIYSMNPTYMGGFFVDQRLIVAGLGGMVWMSIGAYIMKQMMNFEI
jgi:tight adherence protein B